jgi:hypothetical protein
MSMVTTLSRPFISLESLFRAKQIPIDRILLARMPYAVSIGPLDQLRRHLWTEIHLCIVDRPCRLISKNSRSYLKTSTLCSQLFIVRVRLTRTSKSTESTRVRNIRCRPKISVSLRNSGFYGKTKFLQSMVTVHY